MAVVAETLSQGLDNMDSATSSAYQIRRQEVDVPHMVDDAQNTLLRLRRRAVAAALASPGWQSEYPSLRSFPLRTQYKDYSIMGRPVNVFEPGTGAINVPSEQVSTSPLGEFFTSLRTRQQDGFTQLRGLTYYTALDSSKTTPEKKLDVMRRDIAEGLDIVDSIDRRGLGPMDYLLYLGILDHFKAHTLTVFHALTFHERTGEIPDDTRYMDIRKEAQRLMFTVTRAYYQTCLGRSFDEGYNPPQIRSALEKVADYIANSGHSVEHFTFAEVSHPLIILLGAHEAAHKKPHPDMIIGIPSGGTEVSVATHLMYETLYPDQNTADIRFVPLSFHYNGQRGINHGRLVEILRASTSVEGRRVLIVDDNSNSGSTLQRMVDATIYVGANSVAVHIAEIDSGRLIANAKKGDFADFGEAMVVNMYHPDFKTAMGIALTSEDGHDLRIKEARRLVRKAHQSIERKMPAYHNS